MMQKAAPVLAILYSAVLFAAESATAQTITGAVGDAAGMPFSSPDSVLVTAYDAAGGYAGSDQPDAAGMYEIKGLSPGSYFLIANGPAGYVRELHDDIACVARDCPVTAGRPVIVTAGGTAVADFRLSWGSTISGTVRRAADGSPVTSGGVFVYNANGSPVDFGINYYGSVLSASLNENGQYVVPGLPPGQYYARTSTWAPSPSLDVIDELYSGVPCPEVQAQPVGWLEPSCALTDGTPIAVAAGATTVGIDFTLDPGGAITGTIADHTTGAPLSGIRVVAMLSGHAVAEGSTNYAGDYQIGGLPIGSYVVRTTDAGSYVDEWYDDRCLGCGGLPTAVAVTGGGTTSGIDFRLMTGGAIAGTLFCESKTYPGWQAITTVEVHAADRTLVRSVSAALTVFASSECNPTTAYSISGLVPGTYYLRTRNDAYHAPTGFRGVPFGPSSGAFIDQLYKGRTCVTEDCDVTHGTPVTVTGTTTTSGVDFQMAIGGVISGRTRVPSETYSSSSPRGIEIFDARGVRLPARTRSRGEEYEAVGLPPGAYFLRSAGGERLASRSDPPPYFPPQISYLPQIYRGLDCFQCPVTSGTPVVVGYGSPPDRADFTESQGRRIKGVVREDGSQSGLSTVDVEIVSNQGVVVGRGTTDFTGAYAAAVLPGTYYARTVNDRGYIDETYDNVACSGCDATLGAPIVVPPGSDVSHVDFSLARGVTITGSIKTSANLVIEDASLSFVSVSGATVGRARSNWLGEYRLALAPGTYYARTDPLGGYAQERYRDLPCPGGTCDPTTGTPIVASDPAARVTGIDFTLARCGAMTLSPQVLSQSRVGALYRQMLSATGGIGPYRFSVAEGHLPDGLALDSGSGVVAGTTQVVGAFPVTLAATDAIGCTATRAITIDVLACTYAASPAEPIFINAGGNGEIDVTVRGGPTCSWTPATPTPWIHVGAASGTGFVYTVDANEAAAVRNGAMVIGGTVVIVRQAGTVSENPIGVFDTPADGAQNLTGSVAVTGWALDDVGVERVEIWRDLVAGETTMPLDALGHPGHGKVFIANALFVPGARPDVEAAHPGNPFAYRAGWGYLLLTQGLWNQGNGPFTLHAVAVDKEGKFSTIGSKSIAVSNATATKPFGALDTPTYGQTVMSSFWNYGWALTPLPNDADGRGCTITDGNVSVAVDSGPLIPVTYGGARSDIATFFPGFSNRSNAGGAHYVDLGTLTDGTHSIGWYVVDNCGRADGIGSRFFTVLNGSSVTAADAQTHVGRVLLDPADRRVGAGPLRVRRTIGEWADIPPNAAGAHVVAIDQSERVEVRLPALDDATYTGAQVVNGERRALPLGSSLDGEAGIFYWQPAAGFLGGFDLEFAVGARARADVGRVLSDPPGDAGSLFMARGAPPPRARAAALEDSLSSRGAAGAGPGLPAVPADARSAGPGLQPAPDVVHVRVVVGPSVRLAIDTPQSGAGVDDPFVVAGWAIDLAATDGSGIDTVHVWAYPAAGGEPMFLGVADIGDARPDVAAIYGLQFERPSYSLAAPPLAAGTYDIVVYPHRAATGAFDGAQAVRVTVQ